MNGAWTVPAVELAPANPSSTVIVLADQGRVTAAAEIQRLLGAGQRVVAIDPFYFGESKPAAKNEFLYALQMAALGDRPLGLQAGQVAAVARWLDSKRRTGPVEVIRHRAANERSRTGCGSHRDARHRRPDGA
jgi:hypothetical protein